MLFLLSYRNICSEFYYKWGCWSRVSVYHQKMYLDFKDRHDQDVAQIDFGYKNIHEQALLPTQA
ncbi:hypothetical protein B1690_03730 [Geobacillus sp. 46C-IIa]|nr:hypothetical protein B1690_03730 [Geobacillus sp. 46C-IIa]